VSASHRGEITARARNARVRAPFATVSVDHRNATTAGAPGDGSDNAEMDDVRQEFAHGKATARAAQCSSTKNAVDQLRSRTIPAAPGTLGAAADFTRMTRARGRQRGVLLRDESETICGVQSGGFRQPVRRRAGSAFCAFATNRGRGPNRTGSRPDPPSALSPLSTMGCLGAVSPGFRFRLPERHSEWPEDSRMEASDLGGKPSYLLPNSESELPGNRNPSGCRAFRWAVTGSNRRLPACKAYTGSAHTLPHLAVAAVLAGFRSSEVLIRCHCLPQVLAPYLVPRTRRVET
jgi:hypothetical protein